MFPCHTDRAGYWSPKNNFVQAFGVVTEDELRNPQHLDVDGEKCLFVVKNGARSGTTLGHANGLQSFTRHVDEYDLYQVTLEIAIYAIKKKDFDFSDEGDSGSIVLARDGRIVGILTGGSGKKKQGGFDISYATPYWWLETKIKAKFPDCFLYDVVR